MNHKVLLQRVTMLQVHLAEEEAGEHRASIACYSACSFLPATVKPFPMTKCVQQLTTVKTL